MPTPGNGVANNPEIRLRSNTGMARRLSSDLSNERRNSVRRLPAVASSWSLRLNAASGGRPFDRSPGKRRRNWPLREPLASLGIDRLGLKRTKTAPMGLVWMYNQIAWEERAGFHMPESGASLPARRPTSRAPRMFYTDSERRETMHTVRRALTSEATVLVALALLTARGGGGRLMA